MADTLLGGIVINEILADPSGASNFDTDGNGSAQQSDEFVELYNTSASAIDISGLELWDRGRDEWFKFPPGTILQPGAAAVVVAGVRAGGSLPAVTGDDLAFDAGRTTGVLNNGGDNVVLYDPTNDEYISVTYNGDALDDPTGPGYDGFSSTATQVGSSDDFGNDIDGFSIQRSPVGGDGFVNDKTPTPGSGPVCFVAGTLIETPDGPIKVEDLSIGDFVATRDSGLQPLRWIFASRMTIRSKDDVRFAPVRIRAHALGNGLPRTDLYVSQHHRMLIQSPIVSRMCDVAEVLVPAKELVGLDGVEIPPVGGAVAYYHVMLDRHEVLFANGAPSESLYLGDQLGQALSDEAMAELNSIYPDLIATVRGQPWKMAKPLVRGARARRMIWRHVKNDKPVLPTIQ